MPPFAFRIASVSWLLLMFLGPGIWAKPAATGKTKSREAANTHPAGPPRVDSVRVHGLYLEGEFDSAIAILETNLQETRQYRREDSVFIFKHLGVMYAAQFDTREKGKYFMHRLLAVEPTARIMDMYASDMIYMIFRNIQEEYEQNRLFMRERTGHAKADSSSAPVGPEAKRNSGNAGRTRAASSSSQGRKWIWGGAAVAGVAVGVGAYFLMNEPGVERKDYEF